MNLQGQYILDSPFYTFITVILTFIYFLRHLEGAQALPSRTKIASKSLGIFIRLEFSAQYLGPIL